MEKIDINKYITEMIGDYVIELNTSSPKLLTIKPYPSNYTDIAISFKVENNNVIFVENGWFIDYVLKVIIAKNREQELEKIMTELLVLYYNKLK